MHSFAPIVAVALFFAGAQAAPTVVESRQTNFGCYFNGDGIIDQHVGVGHDIDMPGKSGKIYNLDCGTTSTDIVTGIFAKCTIDGKQPFGISRYDNANINCPIA